VPRDRRFVAVHRGGTLDAATHRSLAAWAADCAERLLPLFRPLGRAGRLRRAVATGRAWVRGEAAVGDCMRAAVAAHAAARSARSAASMAVARAAGHAVATAHAADHALGVVIYGAKAVTAAGGSVEEERVWQLARLSPALRKLVESALARRIRSGRPSRPSRQAAPGCRRRRRSRSRRFHVASAARHR